MAMWDHKLNGTDAGAIGHRAIDPKGVARLCPHCKSILTHHESLGRFTRTVNGDYWFDCPKCDYSFEKKGESWEEEPVEVVVPVKPLDALEDMSQKNGDPS